MTHGGKRQGAGRPKGSRNKASSRREQFVALSGPTPIEVMVAVMRFNFDAAEYERSQPTPNQKEIDAAYARALDAAHKAAPYVHPRLTVIDQSPKFNWHRLTAQEIEDVERILAKTIDHEPRGRDEENPSIQYLPKHSAEDGG